MGGACWREIDVRLLAADVSVGGCPVGIAAEEDAGRAVELRVSGQHFLQLCLARTCHERGELLLIERVTDFRSLQALALNDGALTQLLRFLRTRWLLEHLLSLVGDAWFTLL